MHQKHTSEEKGTINSSTTGAILADLGRISSIDIKLRHGDT